jgi:hypothetical protein
MTPSPHTPHWLVPQSLGTTRSGLFVFWAAAALGARILVAKCDQSIGEYEGRAHETVSVQAGEKHKSDQFQQGADRTRSIGFAST